MVVEIGNSVLTLIVGVFVMFVIFGAFVFGTFFNWGFLTLAALGAVGFIYLKIFGGE